MKDPTVKWLWKVVGRHKLNIALLLFIQATLGISSVIFALVLRYVIDNASDGSKHGFFSCFALLILIISVQIVLRAAVRRVEESSRASIENACKRRLFNCLMKKDYAAVTAVHSAEWLNRLTSDTTVCANSAVEIIPGAVGMLVKMIGALVMMIVIEPKFALILFPGGAAMILITYLFRKILKRLHKKVQESDGKLRIFLQEHLENLLIVKSFSAEKISSSECEEKMALHKAARMKKNAFSNSCNIGFAAAMNGMYLIGLGYCGWGIIQGTVTYGTLMAIMQLIAQIQTPFANITGYLPRLYAMTASAERLMEAEGYPDDCPDGALSADEIRNFYVNDFTAIGLDKAEFAYRDGKDILGGADVVIKKGEFTAFTGQSGCGKSTMLKLLMCFYPLKSGERYILDKNGVHLPLTSQWHRLFAYVPQGNHLMCGTIRNVVTFSATDCDCGRLRRALDIACASEFIDTLDGGDEYVLGEKGSGLSEGQMQRIAIARAVYSDAPLLLLDESTSAVDEMTERRLLENIRNLTDKTVLIVTHRPAALEFCSKIITMTENGIEIGDINEKSIL